MTVTAEQLFERTILNELMKSKEYFSKVFNILKDEYFTDKRKDIFKLIQLHYKEHTVPGNAKDIAIQIKNLQNAELKNQIVEEVREICTTESPQLEPMLNETLKFVKDALYLKALEVGSEGLMLKSDKLKKKAEQILEERSKVNLDSDLGIEFSDLDILDYYGEEVEGLLTQHKSLNYRLGVGFTKGTLSLIAAPSGIGKSLMMTDFVSGWINEGKTVLLVSLEMSDREVMKRVHSNTLGIPIEELSPSKFDKERFKRLLVESQKKGKGTFYTKQYPALSFSALQLESLLESFKNEKGIEFDMVLVDYLGIMKSDLIQSSAGLYSYIKSIAEELRACAVRNNIPIISASQLNRGATNNLDSDNSTISDSYGTLMTADFLMFLLQTEEMKATGDIICKITKNRFSGKTESFPMKVNYQLMRFEDPQIPNTQYGSAEQIAFMENFESNKKETDAILRQVQYNDSKLAVQNKEPKLDVESKSIDDLLKDLM